jgi:uncharacterized protein
MKVTATEKTIELVEMLKVKHGDLLFEQSAGCCDGTVPMLYKLEGHYLSSRLVQVGEIATVPYYVEKTQLAYMKHMQSEIDVLEGAGASFSLESAEGFGFIARSSILKD